MKINIKYIFSFLILLTIEVLIALFVHDKFIRPYIGDVLVIILLYCFIRSFLRKIKFLPYYLFLFGIIAEILQYYKIIYLLNLQDNKILSIIIGSSFDIKDILCYLAAVIILIIWEKIEYSKYPS
ncbi:MAG: DUF2809 domain-containing protein [Eubacteriaceae bacterium]|nr:DUF2809 domain-containing protein [Eubacteriaceae bacterium]